MAFLGASPPERTSSSNCSRSDSVITIFSFCQQSSTRSSRARRFRIHAPLGNQSITHESFPRRRNFPEAIGRQFTVPLTRAASGTKHRHKILVHKKLLAAYLVIRNLLVIHFPTAPQRLASNKPFSQRVLKHVVFGHEFAQLVHISRIDSFNELHNCFHWYRARHGARHRALLPPGF